MEKVNVDKHKDQSLIYGFRKAFIRNTHLSPEARFLLIILMTYKGKNSYCWPSVGTLSKDLGRNKDSVRKYLKELVNDGYLKNESRGIGRSRLYTPSYFKLSAGNQNKESIANKPAEETPHQPTESTLNRSISSENKDSTFKTGKDLFDKRRKELGLL